MKPLVGVEEAVGLEIRVHRLADGDVRPNAWEVHHIVESDLGSSVHGGWPRDVGQSGGGVGPLPLPPDSVQVSVVQVEQRI